jgi:hypothetical protein
MLEFKRGDMIRYRRLGHKARRFFGRVSCRLVDGYVIQPLHKDQPHYISKSDIVENRCVVDVIVAFSA